MKPSGMLLMLLGAALALGGFAMDGAAEGGRVLNIGLLNVKVILATAGGASFVGGAVLFGAAEICAAISRSAEMVKNALPGSPSPDQRSA